MRLDNRDAENYAGFGIRYNSTVTCETTSRCGYTGILYGDGRWQLLDMDNVAAEGNSMTVRATDWNKLKLLILGNSTGVYRTLWAVSCQQVAIQEEENRISQNQQQRATCSDFRKCKRRR